MKTLRDYLALTQRTYKYRIKTIAPVDDLRLTALETALIKYDPIDLVMRRTIMHGSPLDFGNVPPSEVYIIDICLSLPASQLSLRQEICRAWRVPDKFIVVRGENDPIENDVKRMEAETAIADEAKKAGLTPQALLLDPAYQEAEEYVAQDMYGDAYNRRFLDYLKQVEDARKARAAEQVVVPKTPMFDFLAPVAEPVGETEGLATDKEDDGENPMNDQRTNQGNYSADRREYRRVFRTKDGAEKVLSTTPGTEGKQIYSKAFGEK